jgi:antitoxin MazE
MNDVAREYRKVNKVGNSLSITIPKKLAQRYGIQQGDAVEIIPGDQGIIIRPARSLPPNVDPRLIASLNKIFADYDETLKRLRDR